MQSLRTVTSLDVSPVAGHHAMPAAPLFNILLGLYKIARVFFLLAKETFKFIGVDWLLSIG